MTMQTFINYPKADWRKPMRDKFTLWCTSTTFTKLTTIGELGAELVVSLVFSSAAAVILHCNIVV
jgi:hypothetical protein